MSNKDLEKNIMEKIETGQVKLRSKYVFLAEKLGLGTAFALTVVLSTLLFNLILFYMKETDNLQYLSFGKRGILAFLESFPYMLVISFIILILLAGYLISRSEIGYKKPFGYFAVTLIALAIFFGGILTYTNLAQRIEAANHPFNTFLMKGSLDIREKGIAGIVFESGEDYLVIETPQGLRSISLTEINENKMSEIEKGSMVLAIGENEDYDFIAEDIRALKEEKMKIINSGIDRKFKPILGNRLNEENIKNLPSQLMYFEASKKECIENCFKIEIKIKKCFDDCLGSKN